MNLNEFHPFSGFNNCNCWVVDAPFRIQFVTRRGAHSFKCPVYRPSRDPVDAEKDIGIQSWGIKTYGIKESLSTIIDGVSQIIDGIKQGDEDAPPPH